MYLNIKVTSVWHKNILYKCFQLQYLVMRKSIAQEFIHLYFILYQYKQGFIDSPPNGTRIYSCFLIDLRMTLPTANLILQEYILVLFLA